MLLLLFQVIRLESGLLLRLSCQPFSTGNPEIHYRRYNNNYLALLKKNRSAMSLNFQNFPALALTFLALGCSGALAFVFNERSK